MNSLADYLPLIFDAMIVIGSICAPIILIHAVWKTFVDVARQKFWNKQKYTLLEITLPKEVLKTPSAMEAFITSLHQTSGESTWYDKYVRGKTRAWFSLEMVSIEGAVRFHIWTREMLKRFVETQIYAQYPDVEIREVKDYALEFEYEPGVNEMWGLELKFTQPDPFPIKTYKDYGIGDDVIKEEDVKVDPITSVIELLGAVGQKQQMWIQVICRAHKDEDPIPFGERLKKFWENLGSKGFNDAWKDFWKGQDGWKKQAEAEVKKIKEKATPKIKNPDGSYSDGFPNYTKMQMEIVTALERSTSKLAFDVGIRGIYLAKNKEFYDPSNQGGLISVWKQFSSHNLNGFKQTNTTSFDFPWQDFFGKRLIHKKKEMLERYKARGYFFEPHKDEAILVLNSEELATIYHFPGKVLQTPTFTRVPSKKAEPPANLPM